MLQVVKRLKKIVIKKEEIEKDKKDRDKKHCKKTMFKFSSNVNEVMKAISNLFFFTRKFYTQKAQKA